jgi:hypothetical protein
MWFPKGNKSHLGKFTRKWFGPYIVQYVLPNNIVLLATIEKFETNPICRNPNIVFTMNCEVQGPMRPRE